MSTRLLLEVLVLYDTLRELLPRKLLLRLLPRHRVACTASLGTPPFPKSLQRAFIDMPVRQLLALETWRWAGRLAACEEREGSLHRH